MRKFTYDPKTETTYLSLSNRELRACEQRMLDDDVLSAAYHGQKGYDVGYAAALDAVQEAVAALLAYDSPYGPLIRTMAALSAINALREEKQ